MKKRLLDNIQPSQGSNNWYFNSTNNKPYQGSITGDNFKINRMITNRNSFLPVIKGEIMYNYPGQTLVKIKMRMHISVIIFLFVWLGGVGTVCLFMLGGFMLQAKEIIKGGVSAVAFIPFAMFVLGWCLMFFAFKAESKKAKTFLAEIFEGEEMNS